MPNVPSKIHKLVSECDLLAPSVSMLDQGGYGSPTSEKRYGDTSEEVFFSFSFFLFFQLLVSRDV